MSWNVSLVPGFSPNMSLVVSAANLPVPVVPFVVPTETVLSNLVAYAVPVGSGYLASTEAIVAGLTTPSTADAALAALIAGGSGSNIVLHIDHSLRSSDPAVVANGANPGTVCRLWAQVASYATNVVAQSFFIYITDSGSSGTSSDSSTHLSEPVLLCNLGGLRAPTALSASPTLEAVWNVSQEFTVVTDPGQPEGISTLSTLPHKCVSGVKWWLAPFYPETDPGVTFPGLPNTYNEVAEFVVAGGVSSDYGTSSGGESSLPTDSSFPTENAPYQVTIWEPLGNVGSSMSVNDLHVVQTRSSTPGETKVTLYMLQSTPYNRSGSDSLYAYVNLRDGADRALTLAFRVVSIMSPTNLAALTITPSYTSYSGGTYYIDYTPATYAPLLTLTSTALGSDFTSSLGFASGDVTSIVSWSTSFPCMVTFDTIDNSALDLGAAPVVIQYYHSSSGGTTSLDDTDLRITEFGRTFALTSSSSTVAPATYSFSLGTGLETPGTGWGSSPTTLLTLTSSSYDPTVFGSHYYVPASGTYSGAYIATTPSTLTDLGFSFSAGGGGLGPVTVTVTTRANRVGAYDPSVFSTNFPNGAYISGGEVPHFTTSSNGSVTTPTESTDGSKVWTTVITGVNAADGVTLGGLTWNSTYVNVLNGLAAPGTTAFTPVLVEVTIQDVENTYSSLFAMQVYADVVPLSTLLTASSVEVTTFNVEMSAGGVFLHANSLIAPISMFVQGGVWGSTSDLQISATASDHMVFGSSGLYVDDGGISSGPVSDQTIDVTITDLAGTANAVGATTLTANFFVLPALSGFSIDGGSDALPNALILEPLTPASTAVGLTSGTPGAVLNTQDQSLCLFPTTGSNYTYTLQSGLLLAPDFITSGTTLYNIAATLHDTTSSYWGSADGSRWGSSDSTGDYNSLSGGNQGSYVFSLITTGPHGTLDPTKDLTLALTYTFSDSTAGWFVPYNYNGGTPLTTVTPEPVVRMGFPLVINTVQVLANVNGGGGSRPLRAQASTETVDGITLEYVSTSDSSQTWLYNTTGHGLFAIPAGVPTNATITLSVVLDDDDYFPQVANLAPASQVGTYQDNTYDSSENIIPGFYSGIGGTTTFVASSLTLTYSSGQWQYTNSGTHALSTISAVAYGPANPSPGYEYVANYTYEYYLVVRATVTIGSHTLHLTLNPADTSFNSVFPPNAMVGFDSSEPGGGYFGNMMNLELPVTSWSDQSLPPTVNPGSSEGSYEDGTGLLSNFRRFWSTTPTAPPGLDYQAPDSVFLELGADSNGYLVGAGPFIRFQLECATSNSGPWYMLASNLDSADPATLGELNTAIAGPWPERFVSLGADGSIPKWGPVSTTTGAFNTPLFYRIGAQTDYAYGGQNGGGPLIYSTDNGHAALAVASWRYHTGTSPVTYLAVSNQYTDYHHPNIGGDPSTFRIAQSDTGRYLLTYNSASLVAPHIGGGSGSLTLYYFVLPHEGSSPLDAATSYPSFGSSGPQSSAWF